ncbi:hypothetical protein FRC12_008293, partial [Ceratobasidium sp. 428]
TITVGGSAPRKPIVVVQQEDSPPASPTGLHPEVTSTSAPSGDTTKAENSFVYDFHIFITFRSLTVGLIQ